MMNNWIVVAILAGLAAAAFNAMLSTPSLATVLLFYLSSLPLFIAGLGWGPMAAGLAGAVGMLVSGVVFGPRIAGLFALAIALPPLVLTYIALINRPAGGGEEGEASEAGVEWYPEGRLLMWAAGLAAGMVSATALLMGPDLASFEDQLRPTITQIVELITAGQQPAADKQTLKQLSDLMVRVVAPVSASIWLLASMINMWLASRILARSGNSIRPWAPFAALTPPKAAVMALGLALAAAIALPGMAGLIGAITAAALLTAYAIVGLAVVHALLAANPARLALLVVLYGALAILGFLLAVPLALLGLADTAFAIRRRAAGKPPPGASS